ncbi:MAG: hypothetical protein IJG64_00890 [Oscillospiraceae bacterium]|nr:hypothetical protein [Oscillospiraceae bacterium]
MDIDERVTALEKAGCDEDTVKRFKALCTCGKTTESVVILRSFRVGLLEQLHDIQRRPDRTDWLIRDTEKTIKRRQEK